MKKYIVYLIGIICATNVLCACNKTNTVSQYETKINEYQDILNEDYKNEEALANYALTLFQYNHEIGKEKEETTSFMEAYTTFSNYSYAYASETSPSEDAFSSVVENYEEQIKETQSLENKKIALDDSKLAIQCSISQSMYDEMVSDGIFATETDENEYEDEDDWFDIDKLREEYEAWYPYNTAPADIWIESVTVGNDGIAVVIGINWHQMVANNVYFKWVDKHLAKGDPPESLTWDIYVKLDWLKDDYPEFFAPPPTPIPKPTQPIETPPVIETTEEESDTEEEINYSDYKIGVNGNTTCYQELTGNIIPINGMTPVALFTELAQTPVGEQIHLQLLDANGNSVAVAIGDSIEHTAYRYAYITEMNISDSYTLFWVAGSDTPVTDNLSEHSVGSVETDKGMEEYDRYENWPEQ